MKLKIDEKKIIFRLSVNNLKQLKKEKQLECHFAQQCLQFHYGVYIKNKIRALTLCYQNGFRLIVPQCKVDVLEQEGLFSSEGNFVYGVELDSGRCH